MQLELESSGELSSARISEKRWQLQQRTEFSSGVGRIIENVKKGIRL
jgi:hypothetical protein